MIFIRNISLHDNVVLAEMHKKCFGDFWNENSFRNMLMDPAFFGFIVGKEEKNSKINCGFILCRKAADEIEIITLCTLPERRKSGFGKLLLLESIKQVGIFLRQEEWNMMKIFLEVCENNTAAIRLYRLFGFEKISKRKQYYQNKKNGNCDADIMVLKICDSSLDMYP